MRRRSFNRRPSFDGIVRVSRCSGVGNRASGQGGQKSIESCAISSERMSKENPKWGASRIHGELLMLGFEVAQSTVSKYMVRGGSPSQVCVPKTSSVLIA